MHHKGIRCGDAKESVIVSKVPLQRYPNTTMQSYKQTKKCLLWHHVGPESELRGPVHEHFVGNGRQMMDKAEVGLGEEAPLRLRKDPELGEGKLARLPPEFDARIDLRRPEEIWLLWRLWRLWRDHGRRAVVVVAADLVLGAVATGSWSACCCGPGKVCRGETYHCGNVSSQRICLFLHVLQPFRDLVWLRLEGPPPGPAIETVGNGGPWIPR